MSASSESQTTPTEPRWLPVPIVALVLLLLAAFFVIIPPFSGVAHRSPFTVQLSNLHQVGFALREYAMHHGGKFPVHISALTTRNLPEQMRQFRDPVTNETHDWMYFADRRIDDSEGTVLATSPVILAGIGGNFAPWRIVVFVDGSAQIMVEGHFQKILSAQRK